VFSGGGGVLSGGGGVFSGGGGVLSGGGGVLSGGGGGVLSGGGGGVLSGGGVSLSYWEELGSWAKAGEKRYETGKIEIEDADVGEVEIMRVALLFPVSMVTLRSTSPTCELLLDNLTNTPSAGAAALRVTVAFAFSPALTSLGLSLKEERVALESGDSTAIVGDGASGGGVTSWLYATKAIETKTVMR
jgi:hypothetical protein